MHKFQQAILTHGGAGSDPQNSDGTLSAASLGMDYMAKGQSAFDAVVCAVSHLENDPRFNAGIGSQIRDDGCTIQMDASCMISDGRFGAVACIEGIQNPVCLAREVLLHTPNILMVGKGAQAFAHERNLPMLPVGDPGNRNTHNHHDTPPCDTVGAVAFDGTTFAAALSSGGLQNSAIGRVGDVPLPGCGLFCGSVGAVACTGDGEDIALKILAKEVYGWLEQNISPSEAVHKAVALFDVSVDVGLIVLTKEDFASHARNGMACSQLTKIN
jgi:beta-aspartyl-peptidase (threonine type)